jgi:hypothetical protein
MFSLSGVLLGMTLVFTQKVLLAGPGFAVFSLMYLARPSPISRPARFADLTALTIGAVLPLTAVAAHFWLNGALPALVAGVWTNNLGWIQEVTPSTTLRWMVLRDPFFCALAVAGMLVGAARLVSDRNDTAEGALLLPH